MNNHIRTREKNFTLPSSPPMAVSGAFWGGHRNFSKAPWEKNGYYELILRIVNFQILLKAYLQPTGMTVR